MSNGKINDKAAIKHMIDGAGAGATAATAAVCAVAAVATSASSYDSSSAAAFAVAGAAAVFVPILTALPVVDDAAAADLSVDLKPTFFKVGAGLGFAAALSSALIAGEYAYDKIPSAPIAQSTNNTAHIMGVKEISIPALQVK